MQDAEIVAAIVSGEPGGLAAAYDRYAPGLYAYCRLLLSEPADAADAVQDTFLIASAKLDGLGDPGRLRPWLYAVARNECFRQLRARGLAGPPDDLAEMSAAPPDLAEGSQPEEFRALVIMALAGLSAGEREVIELSLRHSLDVPEIADVLGVSRNQAHALVARARAQFAGSLRALLAAQEPCPELADLLAAGERQPNALLSKRVNRHVEKCEVCRANRRRELSPAMLLSLLPLIAIPASLREPVLDLATDASAAAAGEVEYVVRRAEPFDRDGFPRPLVAPRRVYGARTLTLAACAAVAGAALLGTGTVLVLNALQHKGTPTASAATIGPSRGALSATSGPSSAATSPSASGKRPKVGTDALPTGSPTPTAGLSTRPGTGGGSGGGSGSGSGTGPGSGSGPGPSSSPTPTPTQPSPSPSPSPSAGTLAVSTSTVTLSQGSGGAYTGSFTITAQGGAVSGFSIEDPAPAGDLSVSPSSGGELASGQSVTVTVTVDSSSGLAYETDLTVDPGGLTVAVDYPPAG